MFFLLFFTKRFVQFMAAYFSFDSHRKESSVNQLGCSFLYNA